MDYPASPLLIPTPLIPEESITSWMTRAALNQGCNLSTIIFHHWSAYKLTHRDFDKGFNFINEKIHQDLAILAREKVDDFNARSLINICERVGVAHQKNRNLQWVLPIPKFHPKKTVGHPYCHKCMQEDNEAYLNIKWRFSWYNYCSKHGEPLYDDCAQCGLPYQPHLIKAEQRYINRCPHCKSKLREKPTKTKINSEAYEVQKLCENALQGKSNYIFGKDVLPLDWFGLLKFYIRLIRRSSVDSDVLNNRFNDVVQDPKNNMFDFKVSSTGLPFENLNYHQRVELLACSYKLLKFTLQDWLIICNQRGLTQGSFRHGRKPEIPKAFLPVYEQLPEFKKKKPIVSKAVLKPKSAKAVNSSWQRMKLKVQRLETYYQSYPNKRNLDSFKA